MIGSRIRIWLGTSLALAYGLLPPTAHACRCVEPGASVAYGASTLVVVARAVSVQESNEAGVVRVKLCVSSAWKADAFKEMDVETSEPCPYPMLPGEQYLLYLRESSPGRFITARCFGNGTLAERRAALEWMGRKGHKTRVNPVAAVP